MLAQTADAENLPWPPDELAVRFHHRLVVIHPFANGNGRHSLGSRPICSWASSTSQSSHAIGLMEISDM